MVNDNYKYHWKEILLIFIAIYIAFGYSVYHAIFLNKIGSKNYTVIPTSGHIGNMSDMTGFASLIHRSNSLTSGDVFTSEYSSVKGITPNISILIIKAFSKVCGGLRNAYILLNILMPILYILLIFVFFNKILKVNYYGSILAGVSILTITDITNSIFNLHFNNIINSFFNFSKGQYQYSYFGRIPHIQISFFFILLFFVFFILSIRKEKWLLALASGMLYGALFYVYFYFWVYATVFLGVFIIISIIRKQKKHLLLTFSSLLVGLLIGFYYINLYIHLRSLPIYEGYILKLGTVYLRNIEKKSIVEAILIIGGIILVKKGKLEVLDYVIISFLSAIAVVMNIQFVTGYTIEPEHFRITVWTPFFILFSIYYLSPHIEKRFAKLAIIAIIIIFPLFPLISNIHFAKKNVKCYTKIPETERISDYINKNEKGRIIAADDILMNSALSQETDNSLFLSNGFYNYLNADDILKRESIILKIRDKNEAYLDSMLMEGSIDTDCNVIQSQYNKKAWLFYFLHTYYFSYRLNDFSITPDLLSVVHRIYENADYSDAKFDVLIVKGNLSKAYQKYFRKVYVSGEYSVFEKSSSLISP